MKLVEGTNAPRLLECVNPVLGKWRVRWGVSRVDGKEVFFFMEEEFNHKPSLEEIETLVTGCYNEQVTAKILSGFEYEGSVVWLSQENQFNYKAAYDLAVQTAGASLPVTFRFGASGKPVYRKFETLEELERFYTAVLRHIQTTLEEGWKLKEGFDAGAYASQE
jgi:hypothetical protein